MDRSAFSLRCFSKSSRLSSASLSECFLGSESPSASGSGTVVSASAAVAAAAAAFSFLCFLCFLCFFSFLCFLSFFFFFFLPPASWSEFFAGDGLGDALLAFLTGGDGLPLAERDGDRDADGAAECFFGAGSGDPETDLEDTLLTG